MKNRSCISKINQLKMRFVVQRARSVRVFANGLERGAFENGLVAYVGFSGNPQGDLEPHDGASYNAYAATIEKAARKLIELRTFPDSSNKMALSLNDVFGGLALISQFTLFADLRKGARPGFSAALEPALAREVYSDLVSVCQDKLQSRLVTGIFGADMNIEFSNWGPVTYVFDVVGHQIQCHLNDRKGEIY